MNKIILSEAQVYELILTNKYRVDPKMKFFSRCIDGRYQNNLKSQISNVKSASQISKLENKQLPALAYPGGDIGELLAIFAAARDYGFEVNREKVLQALIKVIGGEVNFGLHSGHHGDPKIIASDCGHYKTVKANLEVYKILPEEIGFIDQALKQLKKQGANEVMLEGEHLEGAVLMVKGNWGIYPRYLLETDSGSFETQVFIYHQSLVDERHRVLASALLRQKAVELPMGCDEKYLYHTLTEMAENHLMETAKRLAKGLPIFQVKFDEDGTFSLEAVGKV